ncbi:RNA polymerase sporulation sigma factor SigK [Dethiobacter alkaliphilus]|uniref:RNA polymerase sporulation sigma factor SigK n=1 Tax=Dethiobacter alkaliphilus TaxID=427926 RepID=UPI002226F8C3|nr:RNA polymerase sporulation sigma factor SigK [Dethiobacter alkaliphilus]MCW3490405.1 RNA polymerase sporulation sigma factor SigK [Dethiobacter alkaliphilus]
MLPFITIVAAVVKEIVLLVSYLNNNSFPQPLKPQEEKKYLALMAKGDKEARSILIERNLRLVAHVIKKFENTGEDQEDLISIGTVGLIKAIDSFNGNKGTRLATYAARCIENEILMHIRVITKRKAEVLLHDPIGTDKEGNEITLLDVLGSDEELVLNEVDRKILEAKLYEVIKKLKLRERTVLAMRFGLPMGRRKTQKEIAKSLGISRSYVSRIEKKVIAKIAEEFRQERQSL